MSYRSLVACLGIVTTVSLVAPRSAMAEEGLAACGNISLGLEANCEVEPPGVSCQTMCTPPAVRVSCAADLYVQCGPTCTTQVVETEVQVCTDNCVTQCNVDPGKFDCSASCEADCSASCSTRCAASSDAARCRASCEATCTGSCSAECEVVLPSATCQERCRPSCRAVKYAEVNMDCQITCQEQSYTVCETRLVQDCVTDCQTESGALFCDGQFVDHDNNLDKCIDALKNLEISVAIEGSVSVSTGCALTEPPDAPIWLALLGLPLLWWWRRR